MEAPLDLPQDLADALGEVAAAARDVARPWWIIGSAAAALHGAAVPRVADIDLLMGREDAARLLAARGVRPLPPDTDRRFRSDVFGRWQAGAFTVEVMGGLHICERDGWAPILPEGRDEVRLAGARLYVPPRRELIALFRRFGRDKDLERAHRLESHR
ncbi:MAG TPA: hypothetical protein VGD66_07305 [Allosphingosinicella sp.]|jgi:hypothetical protein